MDRKEFLSLVGLGTAGVVLFGCLGSCNKEATAPAAPSNVNIALDLSQSGNVALKTPGGSIVVSNGSIIVAQTLTGGKYLAVSIACPHQQVAVEYDPTNNDFSCPAHGSIFTSTGAFQSGPANGASLTQYKTSLNGNILTITS